MPRCLINLLFLMVELEMRCCTIIRHGWASQCLLVGGYYLPLPPGFDYQWPTISGRLSEYLSVADDWINKLSVMDYVKLTNGKELTLLTRITATCLHWVFNKSATACSGRMIGRAVPSGTPHQHEQNAT
jgi:hypothetical protein